MGKPMPTRDSTVKAVRIPNEILAEFEKKLNGQTINSWLNEQIVEFVEGKRSCSDKSVSGKQSKYAGNNSGNSLSRNGGNDEKKVELDCSEFLEWCERRKVIPQIVMNNLMQEIKKEYGE